MIVWRPEYRVACVPFFVVVLCLDAQTKTSQKIQPDTHAHTNTLTTGSNQGGGTHNATRVWTLELFCFWLSTCTVNEQMCERPKNSRLFCRLWAAP